MNYYIYGYTDKGKYRDTNEDCMLINRETVRKGGFESVCIAPFLCAVCDGVGGEQSGEVASELCIRYLSVTDFDSSVDLDSKIMSIHNSIICQGVRSTGSINMQTTLCCLAVDEYGSAMCYNVGDSRMFRFADGAVRQLSTDQTYGRFLYDKGEVEKLDELTPELKNAIVSSIGSVLQRPDIQHIDFVTPFGKAHDDTVIICSDGVSDYVSADEIEIAMNLDSMTFREKIDALCELAQRNGSTDNMTIVGIKSWETAEEYKRLVGAQKPREERVETVRAENACLAYEQKFQSSKLWEQAESSLERLMKDLENFKASL